MALKEVKTEVIKIGDDFAIPLPTTFCEGTTLKEGSEVKVVYTKKGDLEIHITPQNNGETKCQICNQRTAKYMCMQCYTIACSNCFWEYGNLCNKCINKTKK